MEEDDWLQAFFEQVDERPLVEAAAYSNTLMLKQDADFLDLECLSNRYGFPSSGKLNPLLVITKKRSKRSRRPRAESPSNLMLPIYRKSSHQALPKLQEVTKDQEEEDILDLHQLSTGDGIPSSASFNSLLYPESSGAEASNTLAEPKLKKMHNTPELVVVHKARSPRSEFLNPGSTDQPLVSYQQVSSRSSVKQQNDLKIPLDIIKNCTQDFDQRNFIGKGGYGNVYKGILTWGDHVNLLVAVKQLDLTGFQGNKEFHTEVTMLSQYQHKNIIKLIGFCDDNKEMILVYEYASNGSLDTYLHDTAKSGGPSWPQLLNICIGVASALNYLHDHVADKHRIIHRDIKSANILLDENWNAKLADFGLSRIGLANQQNTFVITNLAGTPGYCDPQYEKTGFLSKESDVYSFGVVLFEVLCGRLECVFSYHDERRFLHHFAQTCYKNGDIDKITHHEIKKVINPTTLNIFSAIAYQCLQETREKRPTISEVAIQLKEAQKVQLEDDYLPDELFIDEIFQDNYGD